MSVAIEELDPHDDEQIAAYWSAGREADAFGRPYAAFWSLRAAKVALRGADPTWKLMGLVARRGGVVLGVTQVVMPQRDNTHLLITRPLVRPDFRQQGVGSALFGAVLGVAGAQGRTTIVVDADRPLGSTTSPGWSFLTHRGFTPGQRDIHRVLDLPVDQARLDTWATASAAHHEGYELVQCSDRIPAEYVAGFCELQTAFNSEAPLGDLDFEPELWTEERLRANEERRQGQGTWSETTLAVAPDGTVVGLTELSISDEGAGNGMQGATLVVRAHRGHRLGMALKVANLRAVQARAPQLPMLHSWNAEENAQMAAINIELGFRPVEEVADMQLKLEPRTS